MDGCSKNEVLTMIRGSFEAIGKFSNGEITKERLTELEDECCPGAGACQGLYTANTMACLTEVMGMSLPFCATAAAVSAKKRQIAFESGLKIVELVEKNITPSKIITRDSMRNAIAADMALGGSTNTILHLLAIANSGEIELSLDDFDELSLKIPQIIKTRPLRASDMNGFAQCRRNSRCTQDDVGSYRRTKRHKGRFGLENQRNRKNGVG